MADIRRLHLRPSMPTTALSPSITRRRARNLRRIMGRSAPASGSAAPPGPSRSFPRAQRSATRTLLRLVTPGCRTTRTFRSPPSTSSHSRTLRR